MDGSNSLGVVIGNTTYAVGVQSIGSYSFTQITNSNGVITTNVTNLDVHSAGVIGSALAAYGITDIIPAVEDAFNAIEELGTTVGIPL